MNKISVRLNILNKNNANSLLLLSVTWNCNRIQLSSGISIPVKNFDTKKQRLRSSASNALEINHYLNNLEKKIKDLYYSLSAEEKSLSKEELKATIKGFISPAEKEEKIESKASFFEQFDSFIEQRKKNPRIDSRTVQSYVTTKRHFKEFAQKKKIEMTFESINEQLLESFVHYLTHKENPRLNNSVDSTLTTLKTFLNWALDEEITNYIGFKKAVTKVTKSFKLKTESQDVALTEEELKALEVYQPETNKLQHIKDLFLILIYTGMRYSDLRNLQPSNVNIKERIIILYQIKTSQPTILPIHDKLLGILTKYEYGIPKYSNQKFNDYVKELCKEVGFKTKITQTLFYGKDRQEKFYEKWQLISSHTGRRTFITLSLKRGALPEMVMQISGHKDRRAFEKYVKLAKGEAQEAIRRIWEG